MSTLFRFADAVLSGRIKSITAASGQSDPCPAQDVSVPDEDREYSALRKSGLP